VVGGLRLDYRLNLAKEMYNLSKEIAYEVLRSLTIVRVRGV
jgi:hypothetical protein